MKQFVDEFRKLITCAKNAKRKLHCARPQTSYGLGLYGASSGCLRP
jgi:hypothetical protein